MRNANWKTGVELFGITAIAGSLIFVGLQMRQAQQIAMNESGWSAHDSRLEIRNTINDHAEIWVKGNAGTDLDPADELIYSNLIAATNSRAYETWITRGRLGEPSLAIHDLSGFLFENPGARTVWKNHRDTLRRYRQPHSEGPYVNAFEELIRADLDLLDARARDSE